MAFLGATAFQVQRGVIARALRLALAGVTLGTLVSFVAVKWIASLLFGTRPTDPATFAGIVILLCVVALFAGYLLKRAAPNLADRSDDCAADELSRSWLRFLPVAARYYCCGWGAGCSRCC